MALPTLSKHKDCSAAVICGTCHRSPPCRGAASCPGARCARRRPPLTSPPALPAPLPAAAHRRPARDARKAGAPPCSTRPAKHARQAWPWSPPSSGGLARFPKLTPQDPPFLFRIHRGRKTESTDGVVRPAW